MAGTMPLISQVPASAPINNRIRIDDIEELILFNIPSSILFQETFNLMPINAAILADMINVIWFDPAKTSSPKIITLVNSSTTKNKTGIRDSKREGFLALSTINSLEKYVWEVR